MPLSPSRNKEMVCILAGEDDTPVYAPLSVLNRSPILHDWLQNLDQVPPSLMKNGRIHFRGCDPQIVRVVLNLLGEGSFRGDGADWLLNGRENAIFLLRMYKLAKSIKVDLACTTALNRLHNRNMGLDEFVEATIVIGQLGIVEDGVIASWIASWLAVNMEYVTDSLLVQGWLRGGKPETWTFTTTLMSLVVQLQEKLEAVDGNAQ